MIFHEQLLPSWFYSLRQSEIGTRDVGRHSRFLCALAVVASALTVAGSQLTGVTLASAHGKDQSRRLQILSLGDLHGNVEAPLGPVGTVTTFDKIKGEVQVPAGGLARMATLLQQARQGQSATATVAVGDMIGGSPFMSGIYHDEPSIHALAEIGLEATAVGNHEFDEGVAELQRMVHGGCHPVDGCAVTGETYGGSPFPFLGANVVDEITRQPILPPYWVKNFDGIRVGFIGVATKTVPQLSSPESVSGIEFLDESDTTNRYADELSAQGVNVIVAIVHEGGVPASRVYDYDCDVNGPGSGIKGPITSIAKNITSKVDLILTGHTHEPFVCNIPDPDGQRRLVTQAAAFGRMFTDIRFDVDVATGRMLRDSATAVNVIVTMDTSEEERVKGLIDTWKSRSLAKANEKVGYISASILGRGARTPEQPMGNVIADAFVEATREQGAEIAFINSGGIRSDVVYRDEPEPGVITIEDLFRVQPFGDRLVTMDLTGAQIVEILRQQYSGNNEAKPLLLQASAALRYTLDLSQRAGEKIAADRVEVWGQPIDLSRTYRVTTRAFLASGAGNFSAFTGGSHRVQSSFDDLGAVVAYFKTHSSIDHPLNPPTLHRMVLL